MKDRFDIARLDMVETQIRRRGVFSPRVLDVMALIPRQEFVPAQFRNEAYADTPLPIGEVYGLSAGIFTENVEWAMKFAREAEAGNLHINWGTQWRVDLMPYGGLKDSGFGKEGPRYAVKEMTELKMVVFHLNS